ncbi:hypothetical protein [Ktedonospora formicarum]|uniref:Uncharacterized protein n=1 Tax=Ktedonospora formicarum TaxID=2778364 RepID=A0A8J3MVA1_9CHLR|nr:hypothetical protein [Ktedonospora formicarum]GHO47726.1 hypothetical protein KSX_58890 [Ktedonospora formicarum]
MSCPYEAAEAGTSSLATPKRMFLGILGFTQISQEFGLLHILDIGGKIIEL